MAPMARLAPLCDAPMANVIINNVCLPFVDFGDGGGGPPKHGCCHVCNRALVHVETPGALNGYHSCKGSHNGNGVVAGQSIKSVSVATWLYGQPEGCSWARRMTCAQAPTCMRMLYMHNTPPPPPQKKQICMQTGERHTHTNEFQETHRGCESCTVHAACVPSSHGPEPPVRHKIVGSDGGRQRKGQPHADYATVGESRANPLQPTGDTVQQRDAKSGPVTTIARPRERSRLRRCIALRAKCPRTTRCNVSRWTL